MSTLRALLSALLVCSCADDAWRVEVRGSGGSAGTSGGGSAGTSGGGSAGTSGGGSAGTSGGGSAGASGAPLTCPDRKVSTLAGSSAGFKEGSAGPNGIALLDGVHGLAAFSTVSAFVADTNNQRIRNLLFDGGDCEVWAGSGVSGFSDGAAETAQLAAPEGVAVSAAGVVHFADTQNHAIRRVVNGSVETLAGDGSSGFMDEPDPRFNQPTGLAVDGSGVVFVADRGNHAIRKLTPNGLVITLAGDGSPSMADGAGASARFDAPWAIAVDPSGVLWISDTGNDRVRRLDTSGNVSTFAGGDGTLKAPMGIAVDDFGNVYVADSGHQRVLRFAPSGSPETLAGADAAFSALTGLALAKAYAGGGLLVGDGHRVRLVHCP
ncbi:MAG: hypothetical protein HS104_29300 [Polyangiaceae bacterium]|nr:hypothetical protein [Polyangiaceae bacterium]